MFQFTPQKEKDVFYIYLDVLQQQPQKDIRSNKTLSFVIDTTKVFTSISHICSSIKLHCKEEKQLCLCIKKVPNNIKYVLLTRVSKILYNFDKYVTSNDKHKLKTVFVHDNERNRKMIENICNVISCTDIVRDMENEPANIMSPDNFCRFVKKLFSERKYKKHIKIKVLNENDMEKQGLNLVLAIGLSSKRMPRFMTIECIRNKSYPTVALVGKTVVYDAGGLSIKTKQNMSPEMKTDKSGGCIVVGAMKYFVDNDIKCNIIGLLPIVENVVSEEVARPGDIIKSYSGKTVEITNTDAEGRLIMADAISYSAKYKPDYIFDVATLTGWSGDVHADLSTVCYSRNEELAKTIVQLGDKVGERAWFLPPWDEYIEMTKSKVANVRNFSLDIKEGAYLPAMFLLNFVPFELRDKFVHFDVCGNFKNDIAQGNCVALLIELLKEISL
jgi:leucyl aminopeptidase